jgi:hypothetical protein
MKLKRPSATCRHLARQLKEALRREDVGAFESDDFSLHFAERPEWQDLHDSGRVGDVTRHILAEPGNRARCVTRVGNRLLGLTVLPRSLSHSLVIHPTGGGVV